MKLVSRGDTTVVDAYLSPILRQYVNQVATQLTANGDGVVPSRDDSCGVGILPARRDDSCGVGILPARIIQETGETPIPQHQTGETPMAPNLTGETPIPQNDQNPRANMQRHEDDYQLPITNYQLPKLMFMQSHGGLTDAQNFQGKDSILSGPAGGIVGAVQTSLIAGFDKIITFDMGGTSTDVAHYAADVRAGTPTPQFPQYERTFETEVAGVRLRSPMMAIHTVAAGGGSILYFDGARYRVGTSSAGANPGPACYRQGGPLTVTDCNVMVGKLQSEFFPCSFGENGDLPLDAAVVQQKFAALAREIADGRSPEEVAAGFLAIAVDKMASAIKKISLQRGYDVSEYTLCCFGGAGGQHACLIADALGMKQVFVHPYAGVLSAYGMGLADVRVMRESAVEAKLTGDLLPELEQLLSQLAREAEEELNRHRRAAASRRVDAKDAKEEEEEEKLVLCKVHLRYEGTDSALVVDFGDVGEMRRRFEEAHRQRYGFVAPEKGLVVEAVSVEVIGKSDIPEAAIIERKSNESPVSVASVRMFTGNTWHETPIFQRSGLQSGDCILGPAIIVE
ncbi:MAG TPA: 5-oxoprolinase, partial [Cyanobacteria bacterium UBA11372]|nr:5-oxoprolinase [Cyanobacteria bacterium UBA11372]